MPKPPRETGREAFNQAQSGRGPPARSTRDSRMVSSNATMQSLPDVPGRASSESIGHLGKGKTGAEERGLHL